jgi:nitrogen-specific signal transduction histidine kinase
VSNKEKIFTNFFSTKGADGTGLGLLNVQKIAQEHGGLVEVESEPGRGSVFRLLLPLGPSKDTEELNENGTEENENQEAHSVVAQADRRKS